MRPDWRIYYDDGSTFDSLDGEPHEAPPEGFICAVGYTPEGSRYIMHGWNFYCYDKETTQWWGCDITGLHDRLRRNVMYAYKEGRTVASVKWQELMNRADRDTDFPK